MARVVVWTEAAADSLLKAAEYIAAESPGYAAVLVNGADRAAQSLMQFPMRGRLVPEFHDRVTRELFVGSYRRVRLRRRLAQAPAWTSELTRRSRFAPDIRRARSAGVAGAPDSIRLTPAGEGTS